MLSSSNSATQPKEIEMVLNLRKEKVIRASSRRMLNQDTPSPCGVGATRTTTITPVPPSSSMIKKKTKKTRRKVRSKTRKPKYLSLRLQLFSTDQKTQNQSTEMPTHDDHLQPQRNFFPLHPETGLVQDKDVHDDNMAYLFSSSDGGASTLTGLLGAATTSSTSSDEDTKKNHSISTTLSQSASLTYAYGRQDSEEEVALLRTAIRNKGRERSEERWVRYSEVVECRDDQEVSSCCAFADLQSSWRNQGLSLKLDYKEILNAWSDKGPLCINDAAADSPQTVPDDIHHDFLASQLYSGSSDGWGSLGGCVWRVPEMMTSKASEQCFRCIKVETEEQQEQEVADEELKVGKREASVQRYKEKRQNRLFSKRIRYQVRKLNAEKRPRLKGRFVKRS